ncbi:flagellar hook-associated protein 3 [Candidatus Photodesmus katoptron]|uniref:flagellar hook-associated protein FlgL n=1 Tax=Candidatus Photodesmus anomalopis TaxID=28176 RepID=UPI0004D878F9|nr:flagellar hook-associated protein FlgL [Candidatus Photodesmus katoptron]KEY90255.1 flagellar hook-associated protein 3 [Candidatus Photodesmus katoptron]
MLNRISSFYNHQLVQDNFRSQENKIHHNQLQLTSGNKLIQASDNPLDIHYIQNVNQQLEELKQYIDSIELVRNRLVNHEIIISNAETFSDEAKRIVMSMINASLSHEDMQVKSIEIQEIANNFIKLANFKDTSDSYVFSGTKSKNQPFFFNKDKKVVYLGDNAQRTVKISNNLEIAINDPGSTVFMEIHNPYGDFEPQYHLQYSSKLLLESAINSDDNDQSSYAVKFIDMVDGNSGYQLEKDGQVVKVDKFDPSKGIQYENISVQVKNQFTTGDCIFLKPRKTYSIFDTFQNIIELTKNPIKNANFIAKLHQITQEFHTAFIHFNKVHSDIGIRMSTLDAQEEQHKDFQLTFKKIKSNLEDLDYTEAVIELNDNLKALQISQIAFNKTKDLTLFNYI